MSGRPRMLAIALSAVLGATSWFAAIAPEPAAAKSGPAIPKVTNPGDPAASEYQEDAPNAFGSVPVTGAPSPTPPAGGSPLPASVSSALSAAGANGRAAEALAAAGIPQVATPAHTPGTRTSKRGRAHHRSRAQHRGGGHRGAGGTHRGATTGGGVATTGTAPARIAVGATSGETPLAQAGPGRSVLASLARAVTGGDGGIGGLLPVLLLASLGAAVVRIALSRREHR